MDNHEITERFKDATVLDDGSLFVPERIIPVPKTISLEAQLFLGKKTTPKLDTQSFGSAQQTIEQLRQEMDEAHEIMSRRAAELYPVSINQDYIGGIKCDVVMPRRGRTSEKNGKILINVAAGGGLWGVKNLVAAIPLACMLNIKVVKPHYRLMPEHSMLAAKEDIEIVYKILAANYSPENIGIYGGSNGGTITFQVITKLLFDEYPVPGAIASWAGGGDLSQVTDSAIINRGIDPLFRRGRLDALDDFSKTRMLEAKDVDSKDPLVSPIYASNLHRFPPSLLTAGTRDLSLSATALMHRALVREKAHSELVVFEAMPHRFMFFCDLPEAQELYQITAEFFGRTLKI